MNEPISRPERSPPSRRNLDPATLPDEVRQKLGWLLLDYLRVCSIGARLPWSGWARGYVGVVGEGRRIARPVLAADAQPAARDVHERDVRLELRWRRHPCGRHAASRRRGVVGRAGDGRACRRVRAGGPGRGRRRLRGHHPDRACGAARPFPARLPEHRHLRRVRHRRGRRPAAVPRRRCRAAILAAHRARRQLLQRRRAILLFGRLRQAHPGRARGAERRRRGAADASKASAGRST